MNLGESKVRDFFVGRGLSKREAEVAELVSKGHSNKVVAGLLFVTEKTVKFHLTNIYKWLRVKSRSQLIVLAAQSVPPEPLPPGATPVEVLPVEGDSLPSGTKPVAA